MFQNIILSKQQAQDYMKSNSEKLYELIGKMSKTEKGYFKKWKSGFSNSSSLTEIFDLICANPGKSEKEILKKIKSPTTKKFFASKKYELFNELVDCLVMMAQKKKTLNWSIRNGIARGSVLASKGMYNEAITIYDKALDLAVKNDMFGYVSNINQLKVSIYSTIYDDSFSDKHLLVESSRQKVLEAANNHLNSTQFSNLQDKVLPLLYDYAETFDINLRSQIKEYFDSDFLKNEEMIHNNLSLSIYLYLHYEKSLIYNNDLVAAKNHLIRSIELDCFNPLSIFIMKGDFIRLSIKTNCNHEAKEMLEQMGTLDFENEKKQFYLHYLLTECDYYLGIGDLEKLTSRIGVFRDKYERELHKDEDFNNYFRFRSIECLSKMLIGENKEALKLCNQLQNEINKNTLHRSNMFVRILKLILITETEDESLFSSEFNATTRVYKKDPKAEFILVLLKTIKTVFYETSKSERKGAHLEFEKNIRLYIRQYQQSDIFAILKFDVWLESLYSRETYFELYTLNRNAIVEKLEIEA